MTDYDPQVGREPPAEPVPDDVHAASDDQDVTQALHGLAGLVSDVDDLDEVLTHIARFAVAAIPGADGSGVTMVRDAEVQPVVQAWAVTDAFVREIDHLQYDICHEGPCVTAMQTRRAVLSGSLDSDARWPRFGGRIAGLNVHSVLSLPLQSRGAVVGALTIYAHDRDAFTEPALRLGEQFAAPAAVSVDDIRLLHAARERVAQLQTALISRAVIDQAIGIVRSRSGCNERDAIERLRHISQTENIKLAIVAERLVEGAVRRANATRPGNPSE